MSNLPFSVPCRVACGDRTGWVVAGSCQPPFVAAVKMDDTGLIEAHAADDVLPEPPEVA